MINVSCAIIENEGKILCAQRSEFMQLPLKWEFPGGKLEKDETLENCLVREIKEELNIIVSILQRLPSNIHKYNNNLEICLHPFICKVVSGVIHLKEHKQIKWLSVNELALIDWAEADLPILDNYISSHQVEE